MFLKLTEEHDESHSEIKHHMATIIWYLIFIFIIPASIISFFGFKSLRYYFPIIDIIAFIFAVSGSIDHLFKDLYKQNPNNIISYLSTNFINLLAIGGISWNAIHYAIKEKSVALGVQVTLIMYTITFLIPMQILPFLIKKIQTYIDNRFNLFYDIKGIHLTGYLGGFIVLIFFIIMEYVTVSLYIKTLRFWNNP